MVDEQEVPGASNSVDDAPSLQAARLSGRSRTATRRLLESQVQERSIRSKPKSKQQFNVYEEPATPPDTQVTINTSQEGTQQVIPSTSRPKKRLRASQKKPIQTPENREDWEDDFETATTKSRKLQVLLEALGHEDFPQRLRIPPRVGTANLAGQKLDPLDPLALWSRFISPQILQAIAENTNEYEAIQFESTKDHTTKERPWKDVTGADIGAYLGAAMLMGVQPQSRIQDYWSTSSDKPTFPIQQYITRQRFQQISRYLKINNPNEVVPKQRFFNKLEPLLSSFKATSQKLVNLPDTVSIDENLVASRSRTVHLMQIDNKAARKGFKIYTLCSGHYLYDWMYTSKAAKVPEANEYPPHPTYGVFTDSERMVLTMVEALVKTHPSTFRFQVVFDNFFSTTRLFDQLREWNIGAYGTAKKGSRMPLPHILLDSVATKERDYGEIVNTVVAEGRINCVTFIDQGAVWMMSTVHDTANEPTCWRPIIKRKRASDHLSRQTPAGDVELPYPKISFDYNHYMNGSDICQQIWDEYCLSDHPHRRNWWSLFWQIIHGSIGNVLYVYRLEGFSGRDISHLELQERLGLQLLRDPASVSRKIAATSVAINPRPSKLQRPVHEHSWVLIPRRQCVVCKPHSYRRRGIGTKTRKALAEAQLSVNLLPTFLQRQGISRKRGKRTTWACLECEVALCKDSFCWQRHHSPTQEDDDDDVENVSNYD
jgi:hypothetical protein